MDQNETCAALKVLASYSTNPESTRPGCMQSRTTREPKNNCAVYRDLSNIRPQAIAKRQLYKSLFRRLETKSTKAGHRRAFQKQKIQKHKILVTSYQEEQQKLSLHRPILRQISQEVPVK